MICECLQRCAAARGVGHLGYDAGQKHIGADTVGLHNEAAPAWSVPAVNLAPAVFVTGMDTPVTMDSSTAR